MVEIAESSRGKSSDDILKQIQEQTSKVVASNQIGPEDQGLAEALEHPDADRAVATEEETAEPSEQQPTEEPTLKGEKDTLYKIKVDGKEKELTLDQLIAAAQKGDRFETKMAEVKKMEAELRDRATTQQVQQQPFDWKKLDEEIVSKLQESPGRALMEFYTQMRTVERENEKLEKRADREFESDKKELPHWGAVKPLYESYRELGYDREKAFFAAEAEFWRSSVTTLREKALSEGEKKAALKQKAVLPSGEKKGASQGAVTPEEAHKMTSEQLAKALNLKVVKHPDW